MMRLLILPFLLTVVATLAVPQYASAERLVQSDFHYVGAFRLPGNGERPDTFSYGGSAITYRPDGDPDGGSDGFSGSLFITGHDRLAYGELPDGNKIAEISIPSPKSGVGVEALPAAEFLQNFHNAVEGHFHGLDEIPRVSMLYRDKPAEGRIHIAWGQHMQPDGAASHGSISPQLEAPDFHGEWIVGDAPQVSTNGYLFDIPQKWADKYTAGRTIATGRFRDGGWSGMGPSLFAYAPPDNETNHGSRLQATTLLSYESSRNSEEFTRAMSGYQHPDEWEGGAFITTTNGRMGVIFVGTKSVGTKYWYGFANPGGTDLACPEDASIPLFPACRNADGTLCSSVDLKECHGHNNYRGWWSTRFEAQIILYDPADLARVASGELKPWQPQPYSHIPIDKHLFLNPAGVEPDMLGVGPQQRNRIGPTAYDRKHNRLFVVELFADETKPVVHVWQIGPN
jgi:hypothetical protein